MPNFKFRLESVLDFRKRTEDQRKKELAHLRELLFKEQEFLKELNLKKRELQGRMRENRVGTCNIEEILNYYRYLTACTEKIMEQISLIETLIESTERKREDLVAAAKERKIMEKLKENQYQEFKATMDSWETKIIDELATNGYTHRSNNVSTKYQ